MAYSRESLNEAICLKLTDIDQASGMHRGLFTTTQVAGVVGVAGAILISPLAIEVAAITAAAGGIFYGVSSAHADQTHQALSTLARCALIGSSAHL